MDLDEMIQKKQETVNTMNYKGRDTMREGKLVRDNIRISFGQMERRLSPVF